MPGLYDSEQHAVVSVCLPGFFVLDPLLCFLVLGLHVVRVLVSLALVHSGSHCLWHSQWGLWHLPDVRWIGKLQLLLRRRRGRRTRG